MTKDELKKIIDKKARKIIQYYIDRGVELQPEIKKGQASRPVQIPKEHIEQWFVQALDAEPIGAGSYPIDIIKGEKFGADIKMLTCKIKKNGKLSDSQSGEASLGQKFTTDDEESTLDELFKSKKADKIVDMWKKILTEKYSSVLSKKKIKSIYYIFLLHADKTLHYYVCGCKLNTLEIKNIRKSKSKEMTKSSVFVDEFIDNEYGEVKIYKAKKRIELRLYPKKWYDDGRTLEFTSSKKVAVKNLRETLI